MTQPPRKFYRRLPGRGAGWGRFYRVFMGADHLLQVGSSGFREDYTRYFYRDIQAISIQQTHRRALLNWLLALPLLGGLVHWGRHYLQTGILADPYLLMGAAFCGLWMLLLLFNTMLGSTCITRLQTPARVDRIWAWNRVPQAQQNLARLKQLVESVQGQQPPEAMAAGAAALVRVSHRSPRPASVH
jgi:hypothetical protein